MNGEAMSLKAKIRNLAKKKDMSAQVVLQNYMFERFLERLSKSACKASKFPAAQGLQIPRGRSLRQPLPIACRLLAHACLSLARPDDPPGHLEAKKLAMLFAKLTKKP